MSRTRIVYSEVLALASCELTMNYGEAWGDAPPHITCPTPLCCSDSEKSFAVRKTISSPSRKYHGSRIKERGLKRSPSVSPFSVTRHAPSSSSEHESRASIFEKAYFSPCPPSKPLVLVVRGSGQTGDSIDASTSTTFTIKKAASYYADIRKLVEGIADAATTEKRDTRLKENTSFTRYVNIACSSSEAVSGAMTSRRIRRHSMAVTRNVAVQAISMKLDHEGNHMKNETQFEWIGGVRALRDSHVRHVLRQLKHIDRLNRALDKVHHSKTH